MNGLFHFSVGQFPLQLKPHTCTTVCVCVCACAMHGVSDKTFNLVLFLPITDLYNGFAFERCVWVDTLVKIRLV